MDDPNLTTRCCWETRKQPSHQHLISAETSCASAQSRADSAPCRADAQSCRSYSSTPPPCAVYPRTLNGRARSMCVLSKHFFSFYARVPRQQDHTKKSYRLATVEKPPWCGVRESRPCAACFGNTTAGRERRSFCRERGGPAARA